MNILTFVFSFLLLLSLTSVIILKDRFATDIEMTSYAGYMKAERKAQNELVRREFNQHEGDKKKKRETSPRTINTGEYRSPRYKTVPPILAKFHLDPLFAEDTAIEPLYQVAARLIKDLYGHTRFFQSAKIPKLEFELLDSMLKKAKKLKKVETLADLFPEDDTLQDIFYHMLQGTNTYNLERKKGYPPLHHFFVLQANKQGKEVIYFNRACPAVLTALFDDPRVAPAICEKEKEKWKTDHKHIPLTKDELIALINEKNFKKFNFNTYESFLNFTQNQISYSSLSFADKKTGIVVKRKIQ